MFVKILIGLCILVYVANCDECDKSKCLSTPKHYKELGCTPVFKDRKCCPERFDCPNFAERDNQKCYFRGLSYALNEGPKTNATVDLCSAGCQCSRSFLNPKISNFNCAQIECVNLFNPSLDNCVAVNDMNSCCATKYICDEEEKNKLGKCYLEGTEYSVGEKMYPDDAPCHTCLCTDNFDNSTVIENKDCIEVDCGVELRSLDKIITGCIPIYYGSARCCPIGWKCPEDKDKLIKSESRQINDKDDEKMSCIYGKMVLQVGDGITDTNKCVDCKCLIPPMAHCIQRTDC